MKLVFNACRIDYQWKEKAYSDFALRSNGVINRFSRTLRQEELFPDKYGNDPEPYEQNEIYGDASDSGHIAEDITLLTSETSTEMLDLQQASVLPTTRLGFAPHQEVLDLIRQDNQHALLKTSLVMCGYAFYFANIDYESALNALSKSKGDLIDMRSKSRDPKDFII